MDDKELADKVVALGACEYEYPFYFPLDTRQPHTAEAIICDWRVAGAIQELVQKHGWDIEIHWQPQHEDCPHPAVYVHVWHRDTETHIRCDSDVPSKAIIAACASAIPQASDTTYVEALS